MGTAILILFTTHEIHKVLISILIILFSTESAGFLVQFIPVGKTGDRCVIPKINRS